MLSILSMDSLLRGDPKFVNGYMNEVLVKSAVNFISGFFCKGKIVKITVNKSKQDRCKIWNKIKWTIIKQNNLI